MVVKVPRLLLESNRRFHTLRTIYFALLLDLTPHPDSLLYATAMVARTNRHFLTAGILPRSRPVFSCARGICTFEGRVKLESRMSSNQEYSTLAGTGPYIPIVKFVGEPVKTCLVLTVGRENYYGNVWSFLIRARALRLGAPPKTFNLR